MAQNNKHPLRLNVGFLVNASVGSSREFQFDFPEIHLHPDLDLTDLAGTARISRTQQGLLVQGRFQAKVSDECVRCLSDVHQDIQTEFSELYAFNQNQVTESGLIMPEDGYIDLEPLVREYLLIEVPISPLCRVDCKGLCPVCGQNLNEVVCEHQSQVATDFTEDGG